MSHSRIALGTLTMISMHLFLALDTFGATVRALGVNEERDRYPYPYLITCETGSDVGKVCNATSGRSNVVEACCGADGVIMTVDPLTLNKDPADRIWDLGTLEVGKVYPTTVTAQNVNCQGKHTFEVSVEGASWFRVRGPTALRKIRPGQSKTTDAEVDLTEMQPGEYRSKMEVRCVTCPPPPKCTLSKNIFEVVVIVE